MVYNKKVWRRRRRSEKWNSNKQEGKKSQTEIENSFHPMTHMLFMPPQMPWTVSRVGVRYIDGWCNIDSGGTCWKLRRLGSHGTPEVGKLGDRCSRRLKFLGNSLHVHLTQVTQIAFRLHLFPFLFISIFYILHFSFSSTHILSLYLFRPD